MLKIDNVRGVSAIDEARVEAFKVSAKAERQPEADLIKAGHSKKAVARLVSQGVSKNVACEQVENTYNGILTGAHQLLFAGFPIVTVTDTLRNPKEFHELECVDPDETLEQGAPIRAKFYNNDNGVRIHSFRHEGINYKVEKTAIKLDHDNLIKMFDQIETVINIGIYPDVFEWGGVLAYIGADGALRNLTPVLAPIVFGRLVKFYTMKEIKGVWHRVRAELPDKLWKAFLEKGSWNVPRLKGLIHNPYFFDGEIIQTKGYNPMSGLYLSRSLSFNILKNDCVLMAQSALHHLRDLLSGFPFENPVSEAVALAMMLTAVQRAILETAPLFGVSANTPGTGKTQLATGIASLATGDMPAVHGFRDNEQEFAKMLMSALLQGSSNIIIDNVN